MVISVTIVSLFLSIEKLPISPNTITKLRIELDPRNRISNECVLLGWMQLSYPRVHIKPKLSTAIHHRPALGQRAKFDIIPVSYLTRCTCSFYVMYNYNNVHLPRPHGLERAMAYFSERLAIFELHNNVHPGACITKTGC